MHVDVYLAVASGLEDLGQGRATRRRLEDHVGIGDRRVADPLAVDVPPLVSRSREEHDHRAIDPGRTTVEVRLVSRTPLLTRSVYSPAVASLLTRISNCAVVSVCTGGTCTS